MKKTTPIIVVIIVIGTLVSVLWAYGRYFKKEEGRALSFVVDRGQIDEVVRVRGEVVPQKDFDLEFPLTGTIEKIYVSEGQQVGYGAPLAKLETTDLALEVAQLDASLAQQNASLEKTIAGATGEDIRVSETKVASAGTALVDAEENLANVLKNVYGISDDAVRNDADQLFSNPRSANPKIVTTVSDTQMKIDIEMRRLVLEGLLQSWSVSLAALSVQSDLSEFANDAKNNLNQVREFFDRLGLLVNGLVSSSSFPQATIDGYKSDISVARSNVNAAIANLAAAEEKSRAAKSALDLAKREIELKKAPARSEDIEIARAQIREIESKISLVREKIRKSTLFAPGTARVEKIWLEVGEVFRPGSTVVSLSAQALKIQSDVSELEIGKISDSDSGDVSIVFDAFPRKLFMGKVVSIEPRKVVKDGDTYYKINVYLDTLDSALRAGMSADIVVRVSSKKNVIRVPEVAVYRKEGKDFIKIIKNGESVEQQVEVGISDGEYVEVVSGVSEGETVAISAA